MAQYKLKHAVLNDILRTLNVTNRAISIAHYLKNTIGITPLALLNGYTKKLKDDGYITLKKTPLLQLASLTESGKNFIRTGGYTTHTPNNVMSEDEFCNFALKEILNAGEGLNLKEIASDLRLDKNILDIENLEGKLYRQGYIKIKKTLKGNILALTEDGKEFIKDGGYTKDLKKLAMRLIKKESVKKQEQTKAREVTELKASRDALDYAIIELTDIEDELKGLSEINQLSELKVQSQRLKVIRDKIFPHRHEIFDLDIEPTDKHNLLQICNAANHYIEFALLNIKTDFQALHPKVVETSEKQFNDGHYREAVNNAFIALVEVVKERFPIVTEKNKAKDGVDLMQDVFSKETPKIIFSNDSQERQGIMFLYAGAIGAIRNKYSHKTNKITDSNYALNLLHFASALFRLFDNPNLY